MAQDERGRDPRGGYQPYYPSGPSRPRGPAGAPARPGAPGYRYGPGGDRRAGTVTADRRLPAPQRRRDTTGKVAGNERLTALTGALLLILFAAEGVTILSVRQLLTLHFFLGMLLVGPVALKTGTVLYRFARYYSGSPDYRRKGPPAPLLRLLGPFVVLTSLSVIGTGVALGYAGGGAGLWLLLHKAAFVLWFGVMTIHVLAYVWRLPRLIRGDLPGSGGGWERAGGRAGAALAGRSARWLLLTASLLAGLVLALLTYHQAGAWLGTHLTVGG